jgi:hypothetical protein
MPQGQQSERLWTVPCFVRTDDGELLPDTQAVASAMFECQAILTRVGGVMSLAAKRVEISPGRFETTAIVVRWQSFVPVVRDPDEEGAEAGAEQPETPAGEPCGVCGRFDPAERPDDPPCQCQAQSAAERPEPEPAAAS